MPEPERPEAEAQALEQLEYEHRGADPFWMRQGLTPALALVLSDATRLVGEPRTQAHNQRSHMAALLTTRTSAGRRPADIGSRPLPTPSPPADLPGTESVRVSETFRGRPPPAGLPAATPVSEPVDIHQLQQQSVRGRPFETPYGPYGWITPEQAQSPWMRTFRKRWGVEEEGE